MFPFSFLHIKVHGIVCFISIFTYKVILNYTGCPSYVKGGSSYNSCRSSAVLVILVVTLLF